MDKIAETLPLVESAVAEARTRGCDEVATLLLQTAGGTTYVHYPRTLAANVDMGDGSNARDRISLLERALAANTTTSVVETIAERDLITGKIPGDTCHVLDASDDPDVGAGDAVYIWMPSRGAEAPYWRRLDGADGGGSGWDSIPGGPESSPGDIDSAVDRAHDHANRALLDALSRDGENRLCLDGTPVDDNRRELEFSGPAGPIPDSLRDGGMLVVLED